MLSPVLTRLDVINQLRGTITSEQLDRLLTMKFKGKRHFKLNEAYSYEGMLFHEMCNFSVTQYRMCEMLWANCEYKKGKNPSGLL